MSLRPPSLPHRHCFHLRTFCPQVLCNVLRYTLSEIAFLRGLFDEDAFNVKPFTSGNAPVQVHVLKGPSTGPEDKDGQPHADALLFSRWLSEGVFKAINLEYLRALCFSVSEAPDMGSSEEFGKLVEMYQYNFRYPAKDTVETNLSHSASSARGATQLDVKQQLAQMFRAVTTMVSRRLRRATPYRLRLTSRPHRSTFAVSFCRLF